MKFFFVAGFKQYDNGKVNHSMSDYMIDFLSLQTWRFYLLNFHLYIQTQNLLFHCESYYSMADHHRADRTLSDHVGTSMTMETLCLFIMKK